jgi:hypothetical protein
MALAFVSFETLYPKWKLNINQELYLTQSTINLYYYITCQFSLKRFNTIRNSIKIHCFKRNVKLLVSNNINFSLLLQIVKQHTSYSFSCCYSQPEVDRELQVRSLDN